MNSKSTFLIILLAVLVACAIGKEEKERRFVRVVDRPADVDNEEEEEDHRNLKKKSKKVYMKSYKKKKYGGAFAHKVKAHKMNYSHMKKKYKNATKMMKLKVTNLAFSQPFAPFFVMVHSAAATPLFVKGQPASAELKTLAETGNAQPLVDFYTQNSQGVGSAKIMDMNAPYTAGETVEIEVMVSRDFPYVSFASMAINTNDAFVGMSAMMPRKGMMLDLSGLDAGTEDNNENCNSIPGPACPANSGNVASGAGEGVVHTHRGIHGVGDLDPALYDWRNPMAMVAVA